ncbi:ERCC4 domain-containing protein [Exiguobacterium sp.]|uniref:ERCC4 domain-containing protein n=1 Tax=Exiguobacterium sp. TaxID=44751 RepID=UPI0028A8C7A9|nr:ERCC4 domain-containing protein [Exiguobacterium sp.]
MTSTLHAFKKSEVDDLMSRLVIKVDTREQKNEHIISFFDKRNIKWTRMKVDAGDYSAYIPASPESGIFRDIHLNASIERKNSLDELAQSVKDRSRFEQELFRARKKNTRLTILVEGGSYEHLIRGKYRSEYTAKALAGSLFAFESRYETPVNYASKEDAGHYIFNWLYYQAREALNSC